MEQQEKPYRKNVGIVVFNDQGLVLAGERVEYPGIFQFPQGGMDEFEDPLDAARRELFEETGLRIDAEPAHVIDKWLCYEFPEDIPEHLKRYRGQAQMWFFFRWNGDIDELRLDLHEQEFVSVRWDDPERLAQEIVVFKKEVYREVLDEARRFLPEFFR